MNRQRVSRPLPPHWSSEKSTEDEANSTVISISSLVVETKTLVLIIKNLTIYVPTLGMFPLEHQRLQMQSSLHTSIVGPQVEDTVELMAALHTQLKHDADEKKPILFFNVKK